MKQDRQCTYNVTLRSVREAISRLRLKCDGTRTETRFRLSAKRTSPFKSAGGVQSTTGSQGVRISGSNAGYTMFRGSVTCTGCPLHSPVSPSLPRPCVTVCHHVSTGPYYVFWELFANLVIQHVMRMRHIVIRCLYGSTVFFHIIS